MLSASPNESSVFPDKSTTSTTQPLQAQPNTNNTIDPFASLNSGSYGSSALWEKLNGSNLNIAAGCPTVPEGVETPIAQSDSDDFRMAGGRAVESSWEPPLAPARKQRSMQVLGVDSGADPPPKMKPTIARTKSRTKATNEEANSSRESAPAPVNGGDRKRTVSGHIASSSSSQPVEPGAPQRRSVRLFNQIRPTTSKFSTSSSGIGAREGRDIKKVKSTTSKVRTTSNATGSRVTSTSRRAPPESADAEAKVSRSPPSNNSEQTSLQPKNQVQDKTKEIDALNWILDLFSRMASGYSALSNFKCQDAIQIFNSLPSSQRETPWVLSQIGRAYYEQALYNDAEKYFVRVKTIAPSRVEDMEVYSTVLWHLKNEVELAYLAHELMEVDRLVPESWCAIGNSYSLQGEHDQALKCFKRATQLDPRFAYAFTLQGHEYVSNEEYDKALDAYRHAISADSRHYNAWYGLGRVYERMGKYNFAEQHYRTASSINSTNVVLICCIGLVLERMGNHKAALLQYGRASALAPRSVLARLRKARSLLKLNELKPAHVELKVLKDVAPDEPNVHYLLGKLYKMMHDKGNAIKHFTTALNLDPKVGAHSLSRVLKHHLTYVFSVLGCTVHQGCYGIT